MADEKKRIINLTETDTVTAGDYIAMDSADGGTKKIPASHFTGGSGQVMWGGIQGDITQQADLNGYLGQLPNKANIDGYYDEMSVGSAEQLLSNIYEPDSTPYLYRTSGGSLEIGDRVYEDAIVGGSVAWNQLISNPTDVISFAPSDATTKPIQSGLSLIANHKYLLSYRQKDDLTSNTRNTAYYNDGTAHYQDSAQNRNLSKGKYYWIFSVGTSTNDGIVGIWGHTPSNNVDYDYSNLSDLTLDFGSQIADYAYSLEQATAGSGIAWLKSQGFFGNEYYANNAGGIQSVKTSAKKVTGFNQWDEVWEEGSISAVDGTDVVSNVNVRSKNLCKCLPNTQYCCTKPANVWFGVFWYDSNGDYINYDAFQSDAKKVITFPDNAFYFRIGVAENPYANNVCVNFHWDGEKDGEYEPYVEHTYALDPDLELRGVPKLVDSKIKYDGDIYASDGSVTRKYVLKDLGTLTWQKATHATSGVVRFYANVSDLKGSGNNNTTCNIVCAKYKNDTWNNTTSTTNDKSICGLGSLGGTIAVQDSAYDDADVFKAAMNGVYVLYETTTPTTESADAFTSPQIVSNWGTEEFIDTRDVPVPVGHDSRYLPDLKAKLESAPNNPSANGKYNLQYENGEATYVPVVAELPEAPTTDGTYVLKATVSSGTATLAWVAEE